MNQQIEAPETVQAQAIIIARMLTGEAQSFHLHSLFIATLKNPNPKGYMVLTLEQLNSHSIGRDFLKLLRKPFREVLTTIALNLLYRPISQITRQQARELYDQAPTVHLLNMIRIELGRTGRVITASEALELRGMTFAEALPAVSDLLYISPNFKWTKVDVGVEENATN